MKCFRSTSINTIERVYTEGIVPSCGRNSRLIGDNRKKVFFSEGFHGTIALLIDFNIVYNKIKKIECHFLITSYTQKLLIQKI